jgi:hypothetical protein
MCSTWFLLSVTLTPLVFACDAGVYFGQNCTQELANKNDPACVAWPQNANAKNAYAVLTWQKGGAGSGGIDNLGGDVFLSTTLNMGCGGGYFGSQMHWNTSSMNIDWAVWDIALPGGAKGSTMNTHPINPTDKNGKPVSRSGKPCSTVEPPPPGFVQCPCSRYSGEGFGTQCGINKDDGFHWEIGTPYLLNISLDADVQNNASAATFAFTVQNTKTKDLIEVGKILTTNPSGTHGIPAGKYACDQMPVGGGSFQEYYDGGNFTNWASIAGPIFKGVEGHVGDVQPTAMTDCVFFGNCSAGGYGGCHNETTSHCVPHGGCTPSSEFDLATQTFKGGFEQQVAAEWVPPWYNWAPTANADNSAGPDGGTLPPSDNCDFLYGTDQVLHHSLALHSLCTHWYCTHCVLTGTTAWPGRGLQPLR